MCPIDHSETPEDKDKGQYTDKDAKHDTDDFAAEGFEGDGQDIYDNSQDDDGPHAETADYGPPGAVERPGSRVLAEAEAAAGLPRASGNFFDGGDAIHAE
jgi:hypothetical protein